MTASILQETHQYTASQSGTIAKAFASDTTTGSVVHVFVVANAAGGGNHTGVTDSQSNTYTKIEEFLSDSSTFRVSHWYAKNITGGTTPTVTASFEYSTASERGIIIREIGGVATDPLDGYIGQKQTSPTTSTDAVTTGSGAGSTNDTQPALISAISLCIGWNAVPSAGTNFTAGQSLGSWATGGAARTEHRRITTTGAQAATFTAGNNSQHISVMAIFDEAPATTKYLKLLASASAQSDTGVSGVVFDGTGYTTSDYLGTFSGASFEASLESGSAVLKVAVSEFGGSALTTSSTPVAFIWNSTDAGIGPADCTVIEE